MTETDPHRTSATLELLTLLTGASTAPAPTTAPGPTPEPADLREQLTDGIVELRKRRRIPRSPEARPPGAEAPW